MFMIDLSVCVYGWLKRRLKVIKKENSLRWYLLKYFIAEIEVGLISREKMYKHKYIWLASVTQEDLDNLTWKRE